MVEHEGRFGLGPDIDDTLGGALLPGQVISAQLPPLSAVAWLALSLRDRHPAPVICVADGTRHQDILLQDLATLGGEAPACFPAWETLPVDGQQPRADIAGERMEILLRCRAGDCPPLLVTTLQALMQRTLSPQALARNTRTLRVDDEAEPIRLADELQDLGYVFGLQVTDPTEAALRGGILDIWPPTEPYPVRLEFFGNTLESIRTFDPLDQRSVSREESVRLPPATELSAQSADRLGGTLFDVLPPGVLWIRIDPEVQTQQGELLEETAAELEADAILLPVREVADRLAKHPSCTTLELHPLGSDVETLPLGLEPLASLPALPEGTPGPDRLEAERSRWIGGLMDQRKQGESVHFYLATQGTHDRLIEQYSRAPWKVPAKSVLLGRLSQGFRVAGRALTLVTENDLYGRQKQWRGRSGSLPGRRRPKAKGRTVSDWTDLSPGELIVHLDHGIGKYLGLFEMSFNGRRQEVLSIEYDQNAKLHLPVSQAHLLTRYIGMGSRNPRLHRLGGRKWATDQFGVERAVQDLAASMLETQATRELEPGHAFDVDTPWQIEFEASFPFEETPDQHRAIEAVKEDMERPHPMDRLICGDVGYGKTEVAMRAAFKAVMNGKQVAVLVPTTILAQQHTDSFGERMAAFPFAVEMLSRFQTRGQQRVVVEGVKVGKVDIVIGTHRLLQKDIVFKDLGLLIIDEEQRFGVEQKETIKRLRTQVDVLTLTATPIPRTLYMSLLGAKEMSTIQSPPQERLPIKTLIQTYDNALVRKAVLREINRGGQVFFLHNRVQTIGKVGERLTHLIPEARIGIGHGQMGEHQLEAVMKDFIRGDLDVLLCTTIIESGVDIPNVNTMIIDRADRFGLAELYQLRGRVGRFKRQAYAYLLLPKGANLVGPARQRITALTQYAGLGSGFKLALKDLEIRGTGNLLGAEQSGHITAIGFELYCQFLKRTVARMKGESVPPLVDVDMKLDFLTFATADAERDDAAVIPLAYIEDEDLRVHAYRKLATLSSDEEVGRLAEEFTDRFGPVPPALHRLLQMNRIRLLAAARNLQQVESRGEKIIVTRDGEYVKQGARFPRFTGETPDQKLEDLIRTVSAIPAET